MLTNVQLAQMTIKRVIFHDVPNKRDGGDGGLVLASAETLVDAERRKLLKTKLTRVLDGKSAYPIVFTPNTSSDVPAIVQEYTKKDRDDAAFIASSQELAKQLNLSQNGAVSSGLLCVIDFATDGKRGLILMKLEREAGAQLKLDKAGGKTRFAMSVLEDLVLTDGTRLFKTAAFLRAGKGDDEFVMSACDSQHRVTDSSDMARFWIKYLGCTLREDPRVATSKFYNATIEFINSVVTDPVIRTEFYDNLSVHLDNTRLKANDLQIVSFPASKFFAEVQLRTQAQHLWSEMSHDDVYKNDETVKALPGDLKRRINLMAGQVEVADREFDRINAEIEKEDAFVLLKALEKNYFKLTTRRPNPELSLNVIRLLLPRFDGRPVAEIIEQVNKTFEGKAKFLEHVYQDPDRQNDSSAFLFQPEALMIYDRLLDDRDETLRVWNEQYPSSELERVANNFGLALD